MKAGRELDAMIAEKVFGLPVTWKTIRRASSAGGDYKELFGVRQYSADISAAWEVVDHMKTDERVPIVERNFCLISWAYNRSYAAFGVMTQLDDDEWSEGNGEHATPLAICLAALRIIELAEKARAAHTSEKPSVTSVRSTEGESE